MKSDRRKFLQLLSSSALAAAMPASISRALEIPANHRTGTIADVEHIVMPHAGEPLVRSLFRYVFFAKMPSGGENGPGSTARWWSWQ